MSLLEFLRKSGRDGQISQKYRRIHQARKIEMPLTDWVNSYPADGQTLVASVMYTRTNDRYFGQWLLLNVPFRDLDDLWRPQADLLPDSLRFLGLCLLHRPDFWRNPGRIAADMEQEAKSDLYIQNALASIAARIELVDAYLSGEMTIAEAPDPPLHGIAQTPGGHVRLSAEQERVARVLETRVHQALTAKWPEEDDVAAWEVWLDGSHSENRVSVVLGPAGSGKSTAVEIVVERALRQGAHVGIACPTGMLAARYRSRHPDADVDTIHGMFAMHKEELPTAEMMKPYDMVVIDEVGQVPVWMFDRLLRLWDAADRRPALVFVGDFCQLAGADGTCARDSWRWLQMSVMHLREMRRCKCTRLRWKLELLRGTIPSDRQLRHILKGHRAVMRHAPHSGPPTAEDIAIIMQETPDTTFVTISRRGSEYLNRLAVRSIFADSPPLARIPCDPEDNFQNFHGQLQIAAVPNYVVMYEGLRVRITRNEDKEHGFVNGMGAVVQRMRRSGVQVLTDEGQVILVHPVTHDVAMPDGSFHRVTAFPLRLGYSTTLHKIQGATLPHVTIWMDVPYVRAALYVALSRVQRDREWRFIGSIDRRHCVPAKL